MSMAQYKVLIYPAAKADMQEIVDYVNTLSPDAALDLYDAIVEAILSLGDMPERCPLLKDVYLRRKGYRALQVKNYTVFYTISDKAVQIRRILYGKRDFEWLL